MHNAQKLDEILLELGHPENLLGTAYIRMAIEVYCPGVRLTKELYPAIAKAAGSTPSRVERAMRHSICTAWNRGSTEAQQRLFGYTVNPNTGVPKVGEYLARLHRVCHEN
jgi:two-component system response regulator (stage 0 sporulation protein A)